MKILMINVHCYVTGGADAHCLTLARELEARGHTVAFLATQSPLNVVRRGRFVPTLVNHSTRDHLPMLRRARVAANAVWNREAARAARELLAAFEPDVVHAHKLYPQLSVAPLWVAKRGRVPVVQTLHDYEFMAASARDHTGARWDGHESRFSYRALNSTTFPVRRLAHRRAVTLWIAVSDYVAERHARHHISATVMRNFIAPDRVPPAAFRSRRGVVMVSRLTCEKGVGHALEAARQLSRMPFTIVGAGALAPVVRQAAQELANLTFEGEVGGDRVRDLLRGARIALVPSLWQEPDGMSVLEAMSCGTPVVGYAVGGVPEYVVATGSGRLTSPTPAELIRAISELYSDEPAWSACSDNASRAVRDHHDVGSYVERLLDVYRAAIDRSNGTPRRQGIRGRSLSRRGASVDA